MAQQEDHFILNFTPTKKKLPNEFRLITSPPGKKEFDLYQQLLNSPIEKKLFSHQAQDELPSYSYSQNQEPSNSFSQESSDQSQEKQKDQDRQIKQISENQIILATPHKGAKGCHCQKSKCSKKYCDCYRAGKICGSECNCIGCENVEFTSLHQKNLRDVEMTKSGKGGKQMKCNCKKSHCLKNYCECHNLGRFCSESCNCIQCDNRVQRMGRKRKASQNISMWEQINKENIAFN